MNVHTEVCPPEPVTFHPLADIFPWLEGAANDALREDIRQNGIREPVVFLDGAILDGRNRYQCARDLGIAYPRREFGSDPLDGTDPLAFVISLNLTRRHLSESQRASVAAKLANLGQGRPADKGANLPLLPAEPEAPAVTVAAAAEMLNVSERSVKSARKVQDKGSPELVAALDAGKVAVSTAAEIADLPKAEQAEVVARGETEILAAAKKIRTEKAKVRKAETEAVRANAAPAPVGSYNVIVLDPPWPMEKIERDVAPNQVAFDYPTMTEAEMAALSLPAADDCHVFTWTTHKFLPMALRLMEAWGVRYVLTMVWHKPGGFQPFGLPQYNCEFAIYGRIGTPKFIDTKAFPTCFNAPRGAHSEKPQEFYDLLVRVTDGRRLDMFNRRLIDGFDGWGNESVAVAS